jgi:hypothetical protein
MACRSARGGNIDTWNNCNACSKPTCTNEDARKIWQSCSVPLSHQRRDAAVNTNANRCAYACTITNDSSCSQSWFVNSKQGRPWQRNQFQATFVENRIRMQQERHRQLKAKGKRRNANSNLQNTAHSKIH